MFNESIIKLIPLPILCMYYIYSIGRGIQLMLQDEGSTEELGNYDRWAVAHLLYV